MQIISKELTQQSNSNKKVTKESEYKAYYDKAEGKYYVHATTLGNLCYYKYFEGKDKTGEYAIGVITFLGYNT